MDHEVLSSILRRERKRTTYKIALLRALNDLAPSDSTAKPTADPHPGS